MLLPRQTEFNRRIPKQKFYDNLDITPQVRKQFSDSIKSIYWKHKLSPDTINTVAGASISEIEVFELRLSGRELNDAVLRTIDRRIPYPILFLLSCEDEYQAVIGHKESTAGKSTRSVGSYFRTPWMQYAELPLSLNGIDLDEIWKGLIAQISGLEIRSGASLPEQLLREEKIAKLQKEIDKLERITRKETQPKLKFEQYQRLQARKKELEELRNG